VARASDDSTGAVQYANATAALPQMMIVALTSTMARQAAELAAAHRLRGADSIYVAVARRYGTTLVTRDEEQRGRASAVITCQTPEAALRARQTPKRRARSEGRE
jgi:predicted nucleic acid-binding protein